MTSAEAGELERGTLVHIIDRKPLNGVVRAQIVRDGEHVAIGWATFTNRAGIDTLEQVTREQLEKEVKQAKQAAEAEAAAKEAAAKEAAEARAAEEARAARRRQVSGGSPPKGTAASKPESPGAKAEASKEATKPSTSDGRTMPRGANLTGGAAGGAGSRPGTSSFTPFGSTRRARKSAQELEEEEALAEALRASARPMLLARTGPEARVTGQNFGAATTSRLLSE